MSGEKDEKDDKITRIIATQLTTWVNIFGQNTVLQELGIQQSDGMEEETIRLVVFACNALQWHLEGRS